MQYPIIDNLIYAYQRNGWTGLELTYGKNLFDNTALNRYESNGITITIKDGYLAFNGTATNTAYFAMINDNDGINTYYVSVGNNAINSGVHMYFRNRNGDFFADNPLDVVEKRFNFTNQPHSIGIYVTSGTTLNNFRIKPQVELNSFSPYEPYAPPKTDIENRLKLPLPHYFPHPVIDALQRAAAGAQTADDTEVLRHYLTPLGIGGI